MLERKDLHKEEQEEMKKEKRVIELIGGVGSGKSRVLDLLKEQYNAEIIQTDQVAKDLEKKGQPGYEKVVEFFGTGILAEDGEIDKTKLAELIFNDEQALGSINRIIHPLVWQYIREWVGRVDVGLLVVETALPDKNPDDFYDEVWYLYTQNEIRIQRLMESRGYSLEKCRSILENQMNSEEYRVLADHTIDNSGSFEETEEQISQLLNP